MSLGHETVLTRTAGIEVPLICGPMFPCSNPELVAAVSAAGGLGVVQPISLTYVYGHDFREGLRLIRRLTDRPIGMNALIEKSTKRYFERMRQWIDIALEEDVRFFITSLGNPDWVVRQVHAAGGLVYHDATEPKWAQKGIDGGVDGLIAVNNAAGGHTGNRDWRQLYDEFAGFGVPLVCAGGISSETGFVDALNLGYAGVQMGTRFIATPECRAPEDYKQAILNSTVKDIVLTERLTGVPVSVIRTPYIESIGLKAGPLARWLLRRPRAKRLVRVFYALRSMWSLRRAVLRTTGERKDYWQAGKSVRDIDRIEPAGDIVRRFGRAWQGQS